MKPTAYPGKVKPRKACISLLFANIWGLIIAVILCLSACTPVPEEVHTAGQQDSIAYEDTAIIEPADAEVYLPADTGVARPAMPMAGRGPASVGTGPEEEQVFTGKMLIHCPDTISENEYCHVTMAIGRNMIAGNIVEEIAANQNLPQASVAAQSRVFAPSLSKQLKVTIFFEPNDFTLSSGNQEVLITLNTNDPNEIRWINWDLTPKTIGTHKISFAIENLIDGEWQQIQDRRVYTVNVVIDKTTIFKRIYVYMKDNPAVMLSQILIPLFTFFGGLVFGRKKK